MFTEIEINVARGKLQGKMNREVAGELRVSEEQIIKTTHSIRAKLRTAQDSITLYEETGLIRKEPRLQLTVEGKKHLEEKIRMKINAIGSTSMAKRK